MREKRGSESAKMNLRSLWTEPNDVTREVKDVNTKFMSCKTLVLLVGVHDYKSCIVNKVDCSRFDVF